MYDYSDWDEDDYRAHDEIWTPEMVAERWKVSGNHVRNLLISGQLKGFKVGRLWRTYLSEIMKFEAKKLPEKAPIAKIQEMPPAKVTRIC